MTATDPQTLIADALARHDGMSTTPLDDYYDCSCGDWHPADDSTWEERREQHRAHQAAVIAALPGIAVVALPESQQDSHGDTYWLIEKDGPIVHQKVSLRDGRAFLSVHAMMRTPDEMRNAAAALLAAARAAGGGS